MYRVYDINGNHRREILPNPTIVTQPIHDNGATASIHDTDFVRPNQPDTRYVAKLYRPEKPYYTDSYSTIEQMVTYMVRNKHTYLHLPFAWPEYAVYQAEPIGEERLVGFLMKYLPEFTPVEHLISILPGMQDRLLLAHKIARSISALHSNKMCIGDLHPGNLLAKQRDDRLFDVHFIDCDSYTIFEREQILYRSPLQPTGCYMIINHPVNVIDVLKNDQHATAHILFELLMECHPYTCRNAMSQASALLEKRIFPCINSKYPAHDATIARFGQLSESLQQLFIRAFTTQAHTGSGTSQFPTAAEFGKAIINMLKS